MIGHSICISRFPVSHLTKTISPPSVSCSSKSTANGNVAVFILERIRIFKKLNCVRFLPPTVQEPEDNLTTATLCSFCAPLATFGRCFVPGLGGGFTV